MRAMRILLVVTALVVGLLASPSTATARLAPAGPAAKCLPGNPQYPSSCRPADVRVAGPSKARARTRALYTCRARVIGSNATPTGSFRFTVTHGGATSVRTKPTRKGIATFRTPILEQGRHRVVCAFRADPRTIASSNRASTTLRVSRR